MEITKVKDASGDERMTKKCLKRKYILKNIFGAENFEMNKDETKK